MTHTTPCMFNLWKGLMATLILSNQMTIILYRHAAFKYDKPVQWDSRSMNFVEE